MKEIEDNGKIRIENLSKLLKYISEITLNKTILAFRGEKKDYSKNKDGTNTELHPFINRKNYLKNEDKIYRESQRFNNQEFIEDKTTFDKLSRIQHYSAPTRLLDISEDLMSAVYFATEKKSDDQDSVLYIFEIQEDKVKYWDIKHHQRYFTRKS